MLKKAFTPYADSFDDRAKLLVDYRKSKPALQSWLSNVEYKQCNLSLDSYLIMPIQRITRYGLLLTELIHQTWKDHPDYDSLLQSLKTVEKVAKHVNEHKHVLMNRERIKTILSQITGMSNEVGVDDKRSYVTEGVVKELDSTIPLNHYLFLFNDVMIWTQMVNKKKFVFRKLNWLANTTAEPDKLNSLKIITNEWTTCVYTNSKEEQNKWLTYLENQDYCPPSQKAIQKRPNIVFLNKQNMVLDQLRVNLSAPGFGLRTTSKELEVKKKKKAKLIKEEGTKKTSRKTKPRKHAATIDPKTMAQHKQLANLMKSSLEKKADDKDRPKRLGEHSKTTRDVKAESLMLPNTRTSEDLSEKTKPKRWSEISSSGSTSDHEREPKVKDSLRKKENGSPLKIKKSKKELPQKIPPPINNDTK